MKKPYTKMNAAELARATREFDRASRPRFLPPPPAEKRAHDSALLTLKRGRGRPRTGAGARRIQITIERTLLSQTDDFARAHGLTRSQLIAGCLMPVVAKRSA